MVSKPPLFGEPASSQEAAVILIPIPFDATASYQRGAHRGPEAILNASEQIDLCDHHFGNCIGQGIHLLDTDRAIEELNSEATKKCKCKV